MGGLTDWTGLSPLRQHAHVKITNRNHSKHGQTGTVVRIDQDKRRVWVALPDGSVVPAGHRSVEVLVPKPARTVE